MSNTTHPAWPSLGMTSPVRCRTGLVAWHRSRIQRLRHSAQFDAPFPRAIGGLGVRLDHDHPVTDRGLVALVVATSRGPDFNIWPSGRVNGVGSGARVSADPVWISSFVRAGQAISS
jgi:hypothetical protein